LLIKSVNILKYRFVKRLYTECPKKFRNYLLLGIIFYVNKHMTDANMIYSWSDLHKYININDVHNYIITYVAR